MLKHMLIGFYIIFRWISMFHRIFHDHPAMGDRFVEDNEICIVDSSKKGLED